MFLLRIMKIDFCIMRSHLNACNQIMETLLKNMPYNDGAVYEHQYGAIIMMPMEYPNAIKGPSVNCKYFLTHWFKRMFLVLKRTIFLSRFF